MAVSREKSMASSRAQILGGGIVGTNAAKITSGLRAWTTLLECHPPKLDYPDDLFGNRIKALMSNYAGFLQALSMAEVVVGGSLDPWSLSPPSDHGGDVRYDEKGLRFNRCRDRPRQLWRGLHAYLPSPSCLRPSGNHSLLRVQ